LTLTPSPPDCLGSSPKGRGEKKTTISQFPLSFQERGLGGEVEYIEI